MRKDSGSFRDVDEEEEGEERKRKYWKRLVRGDDFCQL